MPRLLSIKHLVNCTVLFFLFLICLLSSFDSVTAQSFDVKQKALLDELNILRSNPPAYAKYLEEFRAAHSKLQTNEGIAALDEAVNTLKATKPLNKVIWSNGLFKVADGHAIDLANTGRFSHDGSDGSKLMQRVSRVGQFSGYIGEAISAYNESARFIIFQWLIDDGNARRGHRKILLEPTVTVVGITTKMGKSNDFYCVLVASGGFNEKNVPSPIATTPSKKGLSTTATATTTSTVSSQATTNSSQTPTKSTTKPKTKAKPKQ